jgi:hypothetical protein
MSARDDGKKSDGILLALKKYFNENDAPEGVDEDLLNAIYKIFEKEQFKIDRSKSRDRLLHLFKKLEEVQ